MESVVQAVLIFSLICLTGVFVAVGIWLIFLLKQLYEIAKRINKTSQELTVFTQKLNDPGQLVPGMLEGVKTGLEVVKMIKGFLSSGNEKNKKR